MFEKCFVFAGMLVQWRACVVYVKPTLNNKHNGSISCASRGSHYDLHSIYATLPLKGLAQTKIIKKSVILFWLLNMTI